MAGEKKEIVDDYFKYGCIKQAQIVYEAYRCDYLYFLIVLTIII